MQRQTESLNQLLNALPNLSQSDLARVSLSIAKIIAPSAKKTPGPAQGKVRPILGKPAGPVLDQPRKSEDGLDSIFSSGTRFGRPDDPQRLLIRDQPTQTPASLEHLSHQSQMESPSKKPLIDDKAHKSFAGARNTEGVLAKDMLLEAHKLLTAQLPQTRVTQEPEEKQEDTGTLAERLLRQAHRCMS